MKKHSILKSISYAIMLTGLVAIIPSCAKEKITPINPESSTLAEAPLLTNTDLLVSPTPIAGYAPTIYGVQTGGTGGHNLYTINRNNGAILTQIPINFTGGGGISHGALFGIAKTKCSSTGYLSAVSVCVSGATQFYSFNFSTGLATLLGSTYGGNYIKDIECDPNTNIVYGINGNTLVRMTSFGTMCSGTGSPATFETLGNLSSVGVGPYSISFNQSGDCAIMSAKDHKRAYVVIPPSPVLVPILTPIVISGTVIQGLTPDLYSVSETASCISGTTQFIGIGGQVNASSGNTYNFYKWATNPSGTLIYQLLDDNIYTGMADYTSDNGTMPCPK
jgi:hypothetical protein